MNTPFLDAMETACDGAMDVLDKLQGIDPPHHIVARSAMDKAVNDLFQAYCHLDLARLALATANEGGPDGDD